MLHPDSVARRAWRLNRSGKILAFEAAAALTAACLAVRWSSGPALGRLLRRRSMPHAGLRGAALQGGGTAAAAIDMIERVARVHPCRPRCLERAVAGRWMLARRGLASTLVIGARQPAFEAHAWLEIDGRAAPPDANGPPFTPIWRG